MENKDIKKKIYRRISKKCPLCKKRMVRFRTIKICYEDFEKLQTFLPGIRNTYVRKGERIIGVLGTTKECEI